MIWLWWQQLFIHRSTHKMPAIQKKHSFPAITQQIKSQHLHMEYLWTAAFALPSGVAMCSQQRGSVFCNLCMWVSKPQLGRTDCFIIYRNKSNKTQRLNVFSAQKNRFNVTVAQQAGKFEFINTQNTLKTFHVSQVKMQTFYINGM